ncbi:beta-ketoacyl synthase N-terminal-like domain-containing protein [Bacillus sp. 205(2023)]|uniref:beta-ketoacyl synthase N-terminal-like domain-containing protein n=1 Tax=Bacillus sp. 205(2023) TaxID=3096767 RepID=UPI00300A0287
MFINSSYSLKEDDFLKREQITEYGDIFNYDFDFKSYINRRGLKNINRSTKLALISVSELLNNSDYCIGERTGVFVGTTTSYLNDNYLFLKDADQYGPEYVSPLKFPNTVLNCTSGWLSIVFGILGVNNTIYNGVTAYTDSLKLAYEYLKRDLIETAIVTGTEDINELTLKQIALTKKNKYLETSGSLFISKEKKGACSKEIISIISWSNPYDSIIDDIEKLSKCIKSFNPEMFIYTGEVYERKLSKELNGHKTSFILDKYPFAFCVNGYLKVEEALRKKEMIAIFDYNPEGTRNLIILK